MRNFSDSLPAGWLAFELGVLRRLQFRSVIDPFAGEAATLAYLKRWGARVAANDSAQWALERARARVENIRQDVFDEIDRWTGQADRGDDQTVVILKAVAK